MAAGAAETQVLEVVRAALRASNDVMRLYPSAFALLRETGFTAALRTLREEFPYPRV